MYIFSKKPEEYPFLVVKVWQISQVFLRFDSHCIANQSSSIAVIIIEYYNI